MHGKTTCQHGLIETHNHQHLKGIIILFNIIYFVNDDNDYIKVTQNFKNPKKESQNG